jgi:hypothetical protein
LILAFVSELVKLSTVRENVARPLAITMHYRRRAFPPLPVPYDLLCSILLIIRKKTLVLVQLLVERISSKLQNAFPLSHSNFLYVTCGESSLYHRVAAGNEQVEDEG